jgi:RNA polymerase sigma factor, sigma-70 family
MLRRRISYKNRFLKPFKKTPAIGNENELKKWIRVVVRNTAYNYLRKHKKERNHIDADNVLYDDESFVSTARKMVEDEVQINAMIQDIENLLQYINPEYRVLIELRWRKDLSYKEIAEMLDITEDTVKYKLHRAREAIKKRLGKEWVIDDE